ncbi:MAG: NADH-quinone oxidoreductase subunit C [Acidimicrobiales bacterium]
MTANALNLARLLAERPGRAQLDCDDDELVEAARALLAAGYRLALVGARHDGAVIEVVYLFVDGPPDQRVELRVLIDARRPRLPSIAHLSYPASRFEREMHDLFGVQPVGHPQLRRLVLHQHWPQGWHPLRHDAGPQPAMNLDADAFPFAPVEGDGVYEIPVGPVHAGVIEPGHFRFWVLGETIVRMKARLWFVHKGIERLFEGRDLAFSLGLAEKISGDSAVGHGLAFVQAVEESQGAEVSPRARELRLVLLELERLYNHVADVGTLCNDVGFGFAQARALTLRERLLSLNDAVTGHRLLRGGVQYGGATLRALPTQSDLHDIATAFHELVDLGRSNSIVMDRFTGTGVLSNDQARDLGVLGVVARASGLSNDARVTHPCLDMPASFHAASREGGDVLARFEVRCDEVDASLRLLGDLVSREGPLRVDGGEADLKEGHGTGIIEGWRGAVVHRVDVGPDGTLRRVKVVDPSFFAWPALPIALTDTIVPDFPLVNKSFNLSYAGNDL